MSFGETLSTSMCGKQSTEGELVSFLQSFRIAYEAPRFFVPVSPIEKRKDEPPRIKRVMELLYLWRPIMVRDLSPGTGPRIDDSVARTRDLFREGEVWTLEGRQIGNEPVPI